MVGAVSGAVCIWAQLAWLHQLVLGGPGKVVYTPVGLPHGNDVTFLCINHGPAKVMGGTCCRRTGHVSSPWGGPALFFFFESAKEVRKGKSAKMHTESPFLESIL